MSGQTPFPCAHCGCSVEVGDPWLLHPENDCILAGYEFGDWQRSLADNVAAWNTRAFTSGYAA